MNRIVKLLSEKFMRGMNMTVTLEGDKCVVLTPSIAESEKVSEWTYEGDGIVAKITAEESDSAAVFHIDLKSETPLADRAVRLDADPSFADNSLASSLRLQNTSPFTRSPLKPKYSAFSIT